MILEKIILIVIVQALGVSCIEVEGPMNKAKSHPEFEAICVRKAIQEILEVQD